MTLGNVGGRELLREVPEVHNLFGNLANLNNVSKIKIFGITWA
jgi:hypothetical protein